MRYNGVENDLDEASCYEVRRYIGNSEVSRRFLCFPSHEMFSPGIYLAIYLENGQRVYFTEDNVLDKSEICCKLFF